MSIPSYRSTKLLAGVFIALVPLGTSAHGQTDVSGDTVTATGSSTPNGGGAARTLADRAADVVNVADFGAKGDFRVGGCDNYTSSSSNVVTASCPQFYDADVNRTIILGNVKGAGTVFKSTITAVSGQVSTSNGLPVYRYATLSTTPPSADFNTIEVGTDDTAPINNAIAFARAKAPVTINGSTATPATVFFPDGTFLTTGPINNTLPVGEAGAGYAGLRIIGTGMIWGATTGAVVDALGSRYIRWDGPSIQGDSFIVPSVGLQVGRLENTSSNSADNNDYEHMQIGGDFTLAALLNEQSETTTWHKDHFYNSQPNGYAVILDGYDHFQATSSFQSDGESPDACESFDENLFDNVIMSASIPLWMGCTNRVKFVSSYAVNTGSGAPYGVMLYNETSGNGNIEPDLDLHIEAPNGNMTAAFGFDGPLTNVQMEGFRWREHGTQATKTIFANATTSAATSVFMPNADIDLFGTGNTSSMFDTPSLYSVSGRVFVPHASYVNAGTFFGSLFTSAGLITYSPTLASTVGATGSLTIGNNGALTLGSAGNLVLADGNAVEFHDNKTTIVNYMYQDTTGSITGVTATGGGLNMIMNRLIATGSLVMPIGTPSSSSANCTAGQEESDTNYLYVCTGTNNWRRFAFGGTF